MSSVPAFQKRRFNNLTVECKTSNSVCCFESLEAPMELKERLKKCIKQIEESATYMTPQQRNEVENEEFKRHYEVETEGAASYKRIPKFYHKLPTVNETLARKLREEARALFLQTKGGELLNGADLKHLWSLLDKGEVFSSALDDYLTYADFKKVGDKAGPKYRAFFTAVVFAKLQRADQHGKVHVNTLFNYAMRKVWLCETRINLSLHDPTGQGYLREQDLENYIMELIPTLPALEGLEASFGNFYVCTAARKFLFFLDPLRTGRVRILDILASNFLEDLLELREEDLLKEAQERNWFSAPSALRVYGQYLNLDRDHNGMLSIDELQEYGSTTLTRVFLNRVFQQCLTYDGEMDYKTYLDLVLALENRREPQSIHYLFRILDIHGQGYLDGFTLNYFFKAIQEQMLLHRASPVNFEDVKDEIFDMIRPVNPTKITLKDLITSGYGGTAISILIEFQCFVAYEHREFLSAVTPD